MSPAREALVVLGLVVGWVAVMAAFSWALLQIARRIARGDR